ncbi:MAG: rRNA maturation RNase YbeY [Proteobacteria bacterium]|nr:rRNA maturation RNase YbeY [Pseudomonadota bacterium]MCL2306937.1 rRNA maturation RNase YbeY [Pseudomonadota bacterium]
MKPSPKAPTLTLCIQQASRHPIPVRATLRRWALAALKGSADVTLRFVDTREGRELNRHFRGKDYATNVLTFSYGQNALDYAGDIVLCMPVLLREAGAQRKPWRAHCAHLVVHSLLHLQGYDHKNDREAQKMEARETAILAHLGYPDPYSDTFRD